MNAALDARVHRPLLVLNCGSSSIKFALFDAGREPLPREALWLGKIEGISGAAPRYSASDEPGLTLALDPSQPYHAALEAILQRAEDWIEAHASAPLAGVAHRVVHGGGRHHEPIRIDAALLDELRGLIPLAPLHQPFALDAIETLLNRSPDLPQIACFDTGFHHTLPRVEQMLPLPHAAWERGLRRYGFHGLSYDYMSRVLPERHGALARQRCIVAHLGSGASLCAMQDGRSVATTMGFSALDGLMMGTRCGALDPGALIYLMEIEHLSLEQVGHLLYHESGLLGVSGRSSDPRELLAHEAEDERCADALALYVRRIQRELGALVTVLGGLDLLAFTAGIGEHNAELRSRICAGLGFLGLRLDKAANIACVGEAGRISAADSTITVAVEPTNEEWVAALHAQHLLG